jgi:hypothetical protein
MVLRTAGSETWERKLGAYFVTEAGRRWTSWPSLLAPVPRLQLRRLGRRSRGDGGKRKGEETLGEGGVECVFWGWGWGWRGDEEN